MRGAVSGQLSAISGAVQTMFTLFDSWPRINILHDEF